MGFLDNLFGLPFQTVGLEANAFCTQNELSQKESLFVKKYSLNSEEFKKLRNGSNEHFFNIAFQYLHSKFPDGSFDIAQSSFQMNMWDCDLLPENEKTTDGLYYPYSLEADSWADAIGPFSLKIFNENFESLSKEQQSDIEDLLIDYHANTVNFFNSNRKKLMK